MPRAFVLFGFLSLPVFGQYAGPAILSRGEPPAAMAAQQISFRPYAEIAGIYDTGLAGVFLANPQGDLADTSGYGVELVLGVSGAHSWRHTKLGLEYRGALRHYNRPTYYDNGDQSLMLGITHQFTRHTMLSLRETAGMFSRNFGLPAVSAYAPFDPSASYIPNTDFFDNRTIYFSTQADFTLQFTRRLSFNIGGDYFLNRRRSTALYGVTGEAARGDMQYRLTRRSTIGASYSYIHFEFNHLFSGTDLHAFNATYAVQLTRRLEFSGYGGVMRAENKFLQVVPVDPIITRLFGITSTTEVSYSLAYIPNVNARLSETFKNGVAFVGGGHTAVPGNGLFLTSYMTNATAGYNYTGLRRWSFGAQGEFNRSKSIGNITGLYGGFSAGVSLSRQVTHATHAIVGFSARKYDSPDFAKYNRWLYNVRVGLGFSPGDIPLRVW